MGMSSGFVRFADGLTKVVYFQNTGDVVQSKLHDGYASCDDVYESAEPCDCDKEDVEVFISYGGDFWFAGQACREHGFFAGPYTYDDEGADWLGVPPRFPLIKDLDGKPEWLQDAVQKIAPVDNRERIQIREVRRCSH